MGVLYWLVPYSGMGFSIIVALNALQFALFGAIISFATRINSERGIWIFPFLWTFFEYSRQLGDLAFNWLNIAYTQTYYLYLIQYADITGMSGVVLWIGIMNVLIYKIWQSRHRATFVFRYLIGLLLIFIIPLTYGFYNLMQHDESQGISISYIQPNIDPDEKWSEGFRDMNLKMLLSMTDSILVTNPDLVVWPETAIPYNLQSSQTDYLKLWLHKERFDYHLLTGALDEERSGSIVRKFNSVYFFSPGDTAVQIYHKLLLVPGEEMLPFNDYIPKWAKDTSTVWLSPGENVTIFNMYTNYYRTKFNGDDWQVISKATDTRHIKISSAICYESVLPNLIQRFIDKGSELIVIITNDGWFGYTSQPFQHLQTTVFRAIEQRCTIVRCANNGISVFVDPYGRRFLESDLFSSVSAQKVVPLRSELTLYSQFGDWVAIISGILVICFLTFMILNLRHRRSTA